MLFMAGRPSGNPRFEQGQEAAGLFIDDDLGSDARHGLLQGFDIDAAAVTSGALLYSASKALNRAASPSASLIRFSR